MKKQKNFKERGITLVGLVVTIIILLILAGISIATLTGSGLFEKARLAEQKSKEGKELEDSRLGEYENKIAEYIDGNREKNVIRELIFIDNGMGTINIPAGIESAYVIFAHSTNNAEMTMNVSGTIIKSSERVAYNTAVQNYGVYDRASLEVYKVELTGEEGTITTSVSGGNGNQRSWTATVAY